MKHFWLPITILQLVFITQQQNALAQDFVKEDVHGWTMYVTLAEDAYPTGQVAIDTFTIGETVAIEFEQPMTRNANQPQNSLVGTGLSLIHQEFFLANSNTWLTDDPLMNQGSVPVATLDLQRGLYAVQLRTTLKDVSVDGTINSNPSSERSEPFWFYIMPLQGAQPSYPGIIRIRIEN